jgi:hypothetical protein
MLQLNLAITFICSALLQFLGGSIAQIARHQAEHYPDLIQPTLSEFVFNTWWLTWVSSALTLILWVVAGLLSRARRISPDQSNAISISIVSLGGTVFVFYGLCSILGFSKIWLYL